MYDGIEEVYFRGTNGDLMEFAWGAPSNPLDLGHQMQGTPAVFYDSANGQEEIYYEGANGDLDMSYWKSGNLSFLDLGVQTTASPAAMAVRRSHLRSHHHRASYRRRSLCAS